MLGPFCCRIFYGMRSRLYFDADDSVTYRVHDTQFTKGKNIPVPLGDASAKYRVFVPKDGTRRAYQFQSKDAHGITEVELARQLRLAQYLPTQSFDTSTVSPGQRPE